MKKFDITCRLINNTAGKISPVWAKGDLCDSEVFSFINGLSDNWSFDDGFSLDDSATWSSDDWFMQYVMYINNNDNEYLFIYITYKEVK